MNDLKFPDKFIFGTAVASYQVEGGIYNNDWTIWENRNNSVCVEPCNEACKHYELIDEDINLLKNLGIKAFRFSIEWSRICLLYTSPSPRDGLLSRMPSSA